jgi:3-hydroxybutyryl-CoA dehydrogenase
MSEAQTIAVLGAGTMGNGIAHVCARSGFNVLLCDLQQSFLDRGLATIEKNLAREVSKEKLTAQQAAEVRARITPTTNREALSTCTLAIEAATEKFEIKSSLFRDLDRILPAEAILASNTSSISITKLAAQTGRPAQVIGMHFFNPVPMMPLIEVIRGL